MGEKIIVLAALISTALAPSPQPLLSPVPVILNSEAPKEVLAEHQLDLSNRNPSSQINGVFAFNVLHALTYFPETIILQPGEVFAFHEHVLPEFKDQPLKTGGTLFSTKEGYQTALGLSGNGVCHLASLMNWTASEAGLEVTAKVSHSFAPIPGVPKEFGTSIRTLPASANTQNQNLYLKNNFDFPVELVFEEIDKNLNFKITTNSY